jgi:predicted transcriptional regulator
MNRPGIVAKLLEEMDNPLPSRALASMFEIDESSIRRLCREGKIEHTADTEVRGGMRYLVKPSAVKEYLQHRKGVAK